MHCSNLAFEREAGHASPVAVAQGQGCVRMFAVFSYERKLCDVVFFASWKKNFLYISKYIDTSDLITRPPFRQNALVHNGIK